VNSLNRHLNFTESIGPAVVKYATENYNQLNVTIWIRCTNARIHWHVSTWQDRQIDRHRQRRTERQHLKQAVNERIYFKVVVVFAEWVQQLFRHLHSQTHPSISWLLLNCCNAHPVDIRSLQKSPVPILSQGFPLDTGRLLSLRVRALWSTRPKCMKFIENTCKIGGNADYKIRTKLFICYGSSAQTWQLGANSGLASVDGPHPTGVLIPSPLIMPLLNNVVHSQCTVVNKWRDLEPAHVEEVL